MFADYQCLVVREYRKKRRDGALPQGLSRPSPARLKDVCMRVCEKRFANRDGRALEDFFGEGSDKAACLRAIKGCDIDKFRPLIYFLRQSTGSTDEKNIELLAWLIDFDLRPFDYNGKYPECVEGKDVEMPEVGKGGTTPESPKVKATVRKSRRMGVPLLLLVLAVFGGYWLINEMTARPSACMFWAGDRYEPISCGRKVAGALVIPMDSEKMAHFRKITRPDTITENALGSIWYVKYHGVYECYTGPGVHPVDTSLPLKVLIDYVLLRYIHPGLHATSKLPSQ
jgi:hypothetical protein